MNRMNFLRQEIALLAFEEIDLGNPNKPVKDIVTEAKRLTDISEKDGLLYEPGVNKKEDILEYITQIIEGKEIGCWTAEEAIEKIFKAVKKEYLKQINKKEI